MTTTTATAITPLPVIASGADVVASASEHTGRGPAGRNDDAPKLKPTWDIHLRGDDDVIGGGKLDRVGGLTD